MQLVREARFTLPEIALLEDTLGPDMAINSLCSHMSESQRREFRLRIGKAFCDAIAMCGDGKSEVKEMPSSSIMLTQDETWHLINFLSIHVQQGGLPMGWFIKEKLYGLAAQFALEEDLPEGIAALPVVKEVIYATKRHRSPYKNPSKNKADSPPDTGASPKV